MILLIIVVIIVLIWVFFKFVKPHFIKYDNAILFTGGIGSGKSLNSVKVALKCYRKNIRKTKLYNFKVYIKTWFLKLFKKDFSHLKYLEYPILVSNMPIKYKGDFISVPLSKDIMTLKERLPHGSVVLIDELSNMVNQFNWNIPEIQYHVNEFIQFFRHYLGGNGFSGYLILNAQAESEIVKQIRVKLNSYYICMNFKKFLCFYKVDMLHKLCTGGDDVNSSDFIDNDIRKVYGILSKNYDTYYLSERYKKVKNTVDVNNKHKQFKVLKLIRFKEYESRCD